MLSGFTPSLDDNPHNVTVMSRNLYIGADLGTVLVAAQSGDPLTIAGAVGELWQDVHVRDFPARAETFAEEIAQIQPALIGLQEVSLFVAGDVYYSPDEIVPDTAERIDYLDILLESLDDRGLQYTAVATTEEFSSPPIPGLVDPITFAFQNIQFTDRDVILARADLPAPAMMLSNVQTGNFETSVPLDLGGIELPLLRGWNSVDVQMWGQDFRLINTHLEDDNPLIPAFGMVQTAQAAELVLPGGPADTDMSVILVGDFNSSADGSGTDTYEILTVDAGFTDAWNETHPGESGETWSQNDDLRSDPVTSDPPPADTLERIDLVLFRGDVAARSMDRVMEPVTPSDPATGPLWPSDHAGVAATLGIHVAADGRELPWAVVNDDPMRPGEQALFVVGTNRRDSIYIDQYGNGDLAVNMCWQQQVLQPSAGSQIYVHASAGNDRITLSSRVVHDAMIYAGDGNDWVVGGRGDDQIHGGDGRDWLFGRAGDDVLDGGSGSDFLFGGPGSDKMFGGLGNDWLFGGSGNDELDGGEGFDWLFGGRGRDTLSNGERSFA